MNQVNKIRIVLTDPETRDAVTTEFDDIDKAIEFLEAEKAKRTNGSETTA